MRLSEKTAAALLVITLIISLAACEDDGFFEEAGEDIDEKTEDAGDAIEDATDGD